MNSGNRREEGKKRERETNAGAAHLYVLYGRKMQKRYLHIVTFPTIDQ